MQGTENVHCSKIWAILISLSSSKTLLFLAPSLPTGITSTRSQIFVNNSGSELKAISLALV